MPENTVLPLLLLLLVHSSNMLKI